MTTDIEWSRREISNTLQEISATERALKEQGVDIRDEEEWQQIGDIVARIEQRLLKAREDKS
jgi:hypothetical protein